MSDMDLRGFALAVIEASHDWDGHPGELDGGTLQEIAEKHGVLIAHRVTEPCGEFCICAEYGDWPMDCYRTHPSLLPRQVEGDDNPNGGDDGEHE